MFITPFKSLIITRQKFILFIYYIEMFLIVFCLIYVLQIQNVLIGFPDTSESVNFGICKHEL